MKPAVCLLNKEENITADVMTYDKRQLSSCERQRNPVELGRYERRGHPGELGSCPNNVVTSQHLLIAPMYEHESSFAGAFHVSWKLEI